MTNPYYNPTGAPAQGSAVTSAVVRTEFAAIQAGFDKMPVLAGNAYEILRVKGDESGFEASGLVVDSSGRLLVGDTTLPSGVTVLNELLSTDSASGYNLFLRKCYTGVNSAGLGLAKSRGTAAAPVIVATSDALGSLSFLGYDGVNYTQSAAINCVVGAAPSAGIVPGRVSISVADTTGSVLERFAISHDGIVTLGGNSTAPSLKVNAYTAGNWVTISSGTNPTIGTSGGALSISSSAYLATGSTYYATIVGGSVDGPLYSSSSGSVYVGGTLANPETKFIFSGGATRYLTFTGSIAGSPTIGTSAGNLQIGTQGSAPALILAAMDAVSEGGELRLNGAAANGLITLDNYAGELRIITDGGNQVRVTNTASAVRYLTLTGAAAGGNPTIGTSAGNLLISPGGNLGVEISSAASNVNYITLAGSTTGNACVIRPNSATDTNINLTLDSKGTGSIAFRTDPYGTPAVQAIVTHTASAVNYLTLTGGSTAQTVIGNAGTATDINLNYRTKGIGSHIFQTNGNIQVIISDTAGATRYITLTGSTTNPTIGTSGGNLAITPAIVASSAITSVDYMKCMSATAIPAGGTAGVGYNFSNAANFGIFFGSGAPGLSAAKGSIYLRSDGTTTNNRMYVNTDGGTTWTAVTTVA